MKTTELKDKLEKNGLGKHYYRLFSISRNTVRLYPVETDESNIAIGQTKIGGRPDLPGGISWVTETNTVDTGKRKFLIFGSRRQETITKSLSFIAQINLSQTATFDREHLLPKTGILYFFYSAEQEAWGFGSGDQNKFKVIYWDGDFSELSRRDFPSDLPDYSCYDPSSVLIESEISLPSYDHEVYENFTDDESDVFWDKVYADENINKMLGYSDNIQDDMELECELVTNGLYCGDSSGYNDPMAKFLEPESENWRLLLQVDSNDENGMVWGDCGRLYFWIRKQDLLNKNFDKAWFILQCT